MNTRNDLAEEIVHQSYGLPLKIYETWYVYYHWHEEYEFLYTTNGCAQCVINGQSITLRPGMAILIQSGDLHMLSMDESTSTTAIVVHPSFWADGRDRHLFEGELTFKHCFSKDDPVERSIIEALERIVACYHQKEFGYEFRLKAMFSGIFDTILEHHLYTHTETVKPRNSVSAMLTYIHQHYDQRLTLDLLSEQFHYSKSYIIKLFHQNIRMTPVEYINRYRLEKAKEILSGTAQSVLETAMACGFPNVGYFIRCFKENTGITPTQYRKRFAVSEQSH